MISPKEILHFWFVECSPEMRFKKSEKLDQEIRDRFLKTHSDIVSGHTKEWRATPEGRLAEVIVLDQFSRNMFRNSPKAFESDLLALRLAEEAVAQGDDQKLPLEQRNFLYMPYMHSEDLKVHQKAVLLFSQKGLENSLKYELMHKVIIDRFGRYPHRNEILGRTSTKEEIEFLKEPNSSF